MPGADDDVKYEWYNCFGRHEQLLLCYMMPKFMNHDSSDEVRIFLVNIFGSDVLFLKFLMAVDVDINYQFFLINM